MSDASHPATGITTKGVLMSYITDKIARLKKQKKQVQHNADLEKLNRQSEENYIDQQINAQKDAQIRDKKQAKQAQRKVIVAESRALVFNAYDLLRKMGIVKIKQDMSRLFNRHKSYFLMLECSNQAPPLDALIDLKDNLNVIKCYLREFLESDDPVFHDWARGKLNRIIEGLDRLELKILKEIYGVIT